jgi:hypothetical protein
MNSKSFSPDVIIQAIWRCLILQLIETSIIKFGINMMSAHVLFLDIFSYTGYKYLTLCINYITKIIFYNSTIINIIISSCTSLMLSYFVLKTMAAVVPVGSTTGPPRHLLLLGFAFMQFLVIITLSML